MTFFLIIELIIPHEDDESKQMSQSKSKRGATPALIGISISIILLIGLFIAEQLLGRFAVIFRPSAFIEIRNFRIAIIHCLLAGYLPAAYLYILRSARSIINELNPILVSSDVHKNSKVRQITKKKFIFSGVLGVLMTVLTPYLSAQSPWSPSGWTPEIVWHRILGPVIGWWAGCFCYAVVKESIRISRTAALIQKIDLLDLKPLEPFVRQGLVNALLVVGVVAIFSITLIEPGMEMTVVVVAGITLPIAFIGLFLPVFGVHRRIHEAKQVELTWTFEEIRQAQLRLKDPSIGPTQSKMADLTTYYRLIDRIPEWPFRTSTFFQAILYLLIPVVTWLAGLLIDSALTLLFG